jgi:hypothetical protein
LGFVQIMLLFIGAVIVVYLIIAGLVFAGGRRQHKRYRPGRPFEFIPVWFLAAPQEQSRSGRAPGQALAIAAGSTSRRPKETGGASDSW